MTEVGNNQTINSSPTADAAWASSSTSSPHSVKNDLNARASTIPEPITGELLPATPSRLTAGQEATAYEDTLRENDGRDCENNSRVPSTTSISAGKRSHNSKEIAATASTAAEQANQSQGVNHADYARSKIEGYLKSRRVGEAGADSQSKMKVDAFLRGRCTEATDQANRNDDVDHADADAIVESQPECDPDVQLKIASFLQSRCERAKKKITTKKEKKKMKPKEKPKCLWEGCDKYRQQKCNGYCVNHKHRMCHNRRCGKCKPREEYSASQWSNPQRICLVCQHRLQQQQLKLQQQQQQQQQLGDNRADVEQPNDKLVSNPETTTNKDEKTTSKIEEGNIAATALGVNTDHYDNGVSDNAKPYIPGDPGAEIENAPCLWEGCDVLARKNCDGYCAAHRHLPCQGPCGIARTKMAYSSSMWADPRRVCLACCQLRRRRREKRDRISASLLSSRGAGVLEHRPGKKAKPNADAAVDEGVKGSVEPEKVRRGVNGQLLCLWEGCEKYRQHKCNGYCIDHHKYLLDPSRGDMQQPQGNLETTANGEEKIASKIEEDTATTVDAAVSSDARLHDEGVSHNASPAIQVPNDDDLLPPVIGDKKNGFSPLGRVRSCMCPNPAGCRSIVWRWVRLREAKYVFFQTFPRRPTARTPARTSEQARTRQHMSAYNLASLRSLGYDGSEITRVTNYGKQTHTTNKNGTIFSGRLSIVHFHPEVMQYVIHAKENVDVAERWRVPIELGEKLGLKDEDKCPSPNARGEQSYFALPNYSLEQATADVEKAEAQYLEKAREFHVQNAAMLAEVASNPSKYMVKIHDLEQWNATLLKSNKEMKERAKKNLAEKRAMEQKNELLHKGLEELARRMDKWESTLKIGGTPNRDAKDIYKKTTGKDLSEEGFFGVEPGLGSNGWVDPRMDRAVQAKWDNPTISAEEALRVGGFDFPPLDGKGVIEKSCTDSDGVTITKRKENLGKQLKAKKMAMKRKAASNPDVAREYAQRYPPPVEVVEGVYNGLDLRGVPDQPLVRSKRSTTGYRGVKSYGGTFTVRIGSGVNGKCVCLGTYETAEEAAGIYARATFYQNQQKKKRAALSLSQSDPAEVVFAAADSDHQIRNGKGSDGEDNGSDDSNSEGSDDNDTEEMKMAEETYDAYQAEISPENYYAEC